MEHRLAQVTISDMPYAAFLNVHALALPVYGMLHRVLPDFFPRHFKPEGYGEVPATHILSTDESGTHPSLKGRQILVVSGEIRYSRRMGETPAEWIIDSSAGVECLGYSFMVEIAGIERTTNVGRVVRLADNPSVVAEEIEYWPEIAYRRNLRVHFPTPDTYSVWTNGSAFKGKPTGRLAGLLPSRERLGGKELTEQAVGLDTPKLLEDIIHGLLRFPMPVQAKR